jgi:helix-turn-helix protein
MTRETVDRETSMRVLREGSVSDSLIAAAFGVSRQHLHKLLGSRPAPPRREKMKPDTEGLPEDFPTWLLRWRKAHGLTQTEAGALVGVSWNTWARWERGDDGCSLPFLLYHYLKRIAKPAKYLLTYYS